MPFSPRFLALVWLASAFGVVPLRAAEPAAGHSTHGEAFNEGPRQQAVLMDGLPRLKFEITTSKPLAQRFFLQGIAQLHGFWYWEAERSFRQAAAYDPGCAMAYWGMAMANVNNDKRAKAFLVNAVGGKEDVTPRERQWIEMLENFYRDDKRDAKQRTLDCIRDLETLVQEFPEDVEAKAFLVWKIWQGKDKAPISSPMAVNALLDQIFAADPDHPAHHYRIHLWDGFKPAMALASAAACGPCSPSIAHMWHMPGHIYSKLKRFDDAAWQQAASSCVDHAYMIRQLLPPDRIHNYAHNEEWLVRTYNELGRAKDALALARSLVAVPRYPDLNTLDKANTSASYGRTRLIETLVKWELWSELRRLSATPWLSAADAPPAHQVTLQRALASAAFAEKDAAALRRAIAELEKLQPKAKTTAETKSKVGKAAELTPPAPATETRKALPANAAAKAAQKTAQAAKSDAPPAAPPQTKPSAPAPKKDLAAAPAPDATKKLTPAPDTSAKPKAEPKKKKPEPAVVALQEARALLQVLEKKPDAAEALLAAEYLDATERVRALLHLGRKEDAVKQIEKLPQDLLGQIIRAHTAWQGGDRALAESAFKKAHDLAYAMDTDLPAARRLFQLAYKLKHGGKWRADPPVRDDLGERPAFDRLGPLHWHPPTAPMLKLEPVSDSPPDLHAAQPRLLLFYLGAGCSHCVEQLDAFAKTAEAWKKAGITVHAAAPGTQAEVTQTWDVVESGKNLPFPIWRDPTGETFKAWRAWDDFEKMPLHATILLDAENRVRWLDISWQPFMDAAFLLKEAQRLLSLDEVDQFTALPTSDDAKQVVSSANR